MNALCHGMLNWIKFSFAELSIMASNENSIMEMGNFPHLGIAF